jgi:hypothetical protein
MLGPIEKWLGQDNFEYCFVLADPEQLTFHLVQQH